MQTDTDPTVNAPAMNALTPATEPVTVNPDQIYRSGRVLVERGDYVRALAVFEQAHRLWPADRRVRSYLGLCLAETGKKVRVALDICEKAARAELMRPELFRNLGRVSEIAGDRRRAHDAYRRGLALDAGDTDLQRAIAGLGIRKPPVIPFLPRGHAVNRVTGRLLGKLGLR